MGPYTTHRCELVLHADRQHVRILHPKYNIAFLYATWICTSDLDTVPKLPPLSPQTQTVYIYIFHEDFDQIIMFRD